MLTKIIIGVVQIACGTAFLAFKVFEITSRDFSYATKEVSRTIFSYEISAFVLFLVTGSFLIATRLSSSHKFLATASLVLAVLSCLYTLSLLVLVVGPHPDPGAICWTVAASVMLGASATSAVLLLASTCCGSTSPESTSREAAKRSSTQGASDSRSCSRAPPRRGVTRGDTSETELGGEGNRGQSNSAFTA